MNATRRATLAVAILGSGLAAQAAIDATYPSTRPPLRAPLASLPYKLGSWEGRDEPLDREILERTQADDFLNRVYEDRRHPGRTVKLWINYSRHGLNMRHSPEVCLPSGGWTKVESQSRTLQVDRPEGSPLTLTRLIYQQEEMVQGIGFWYYICGEGPLERFARTLPITSRSSHGRTTRGSGLTVEVFFPGGSDPESAQLREFVSEVLASLEPILPEERISYHVP